MRIKFKKLKELREFWERTITLQIESKSYFRFLCKGINL